MGFSQATYFSTEVHVHKIKCMYVHKIKCKYVHKIKCKYVHKICVCTQYQVYVRKIKCMYTRSEGLVYSNKELIMNTVHSKPDQQVYTWEGGGGRRDVSWPARWFLFLPGD